MNNKTRFFVMNFLVTLILVTLFEYEYLYISSYIIFNFIVFLPKQIFHPNFILTAFYFLYLILPSTLYLVLEVSQYSYILPWGKVVFWDSFEKITYYQLLFTYTTLFICFHNFCLNQNKTFNIKHLHFKNNTFFLGIGVLVLSIYFFKVTGGVNSWFTNFSETFVSKRAGHGLTNIFLMVFGNIYVFLLGLFFYLKKEKKYLIVAFFFIFIIGFLQGAKSRYIFLLINFFSPFLFGLKINLKKIFFLGLSFFGLLYVTTLVRTGGFYAGAFFIEYMISYFDAFQLHDLVVKSKDLAFFETQYQAFVKPLQILGLLSEDYNFDLSVMLTKEFYPDLWYNSNGTKQWPLETDLYLNYYGILFSWVVLIPYAYIISTLYNKVIKGNFFLILIFLLEFLRIFSTLRGTIIPYNLSLTLITYMIIYLSMKYYLKKSNETLL